MTIQEIKYSLAGKNQFDIDYKSVLYERLVFNNTSIGVQPCDLLLLAQENFHLVIFKDQLSFDRVIDLDLNS